MWESGGARVRMKGEGRRDEKEKITNAGEEGAQKKTDSGERKLGGERREGPGRQPTGDPLGEEAVRTGQ